MTIIDIYNLQREKTSQLELKEEVFNVLIKKHILHQVVVGQLLNKKSGSASTKGRSDVRGSSKKVSRQKGTGRARVGTASSPTRRGGGVAFGPIPGKCVSKVPKKIRRAALRMALTDKFQTDRLVVVTDFSLPEIKTRNFVQVMKKFEINRALIITDDKNENLEKSSKNVPWVKVMRYQGLNVYDILKHDHLFLVQSAISKIEEALIS
ncbi:MAG: 50S ribosomal protein L4 [Deltaproteobacteria bacterium]|nr:50S ribosomal protein L4 [Deltaproteobacteria bacterium]MBW1912486.1 50S ribosomal protein L4 [Deltaproteobacteria bacterium]